MSNTEPRMQAPAEADYVPCAPLDGQQLKGFIEASLTWLKTNQQLVNMLNVFPVPDGDTGTNMVLTMQAAYNEIAGSGERNAGKMAHMVAQGALMGARGNSGVILSQILRGFARALDNLDTMDGKALVDALREGKTTAYKGVVRPVEGTILTVAKDMAACGETALAENHNLGYILQRVVEGADRSVRSTPELLPILKSAGVVDSGGKGLFFILDGMLRHVKGLPLDVATAAVTPLSQMKLENSLEAIEPGQDFEVVVDFQPKNSLELDRFYNELAQIGSSIQVGEGDGIYRMHIHVPTEKLYDPIEYTRNIGTVTRVTIENLRAQIEDVTEESRPHLTLTPVEPGQIATICVSPGAGISRIFASLGASGIVHGGQTMNPSTEEILGAFENLPTDRIIILPNNKNIVMAAQSAKSLTVKQVKIVPTYSVPQGLAAMLRLAPDGDLNEIYAEMNAAMAEVITGEITTATRSVEMNGVQVQQGQVIALLDGKLVYSATNVDEACLGLLAKAHADDHERITLFYGSNFSKTDVNVLSDKIRSVYPSQELEVHEGDQPHYQLIISIE